MMPMICAGSIRSSRRTRCLATVSARRVSSASTCGVEFVERPRQRADDGFERRDLHVHFGDALGEFGFALAHAFDVAVLVTMFPGFALHDA